MSASSTERIQLLSNASATGNYKQVIGGIYRFRAVATWGGGSVKLQAPGPDGSTAIDVASSSLTADGDVLLYLPPGQYKANVATATAVYADLSRVAL